MFSMLELGDPKWVASTMGLGADRRDLHLDQRLSAVYAAAYGWKSNLVFTEFDDGYIVQPILITKEQEIRHAYNFGGPIGSNDELDAREHVENLNEWVVKQGVKHQYCTLIPNLAEKQLKLLNSAEIYPEFRKNSVIIDLNNQKIRGTTRRLANKAQGLGVTVKQYEYDHLSRFIDIYEATMDRVKAKEHWNFTDKWWQAFVRFVKPCLLLAEYEGKIESGCLIAYSQQYLVAYYHFAGSYNNHPGLGINHQMVLSACEFVKSVGISKLYLGGGFTDNDDDSLLTFKAGFSKDRLPVYSYSITY